MIDDPKGEIGNQQITPQYIAGIWDGEGSFSITRHKIQRGRYEQLRANVSMSNTDERIIHAVKKYAYSIGCGCWIRAYPRRPNTKMQYELKIVSLADRIKFTKSILPYLIGKKERAELLLEFLESRLNKISTRRDGFGRYLGRVGFSDEERKLYESVKCMNVRGIPETLRHTPNGEDKVRPTLKDVELGRNDQATQLGLFN
jgi:hypothetical protein